MSIAQCISVLLAFELPPLSVSRMSTFSTANRSNVSAILGMCTSYRSSVASSTLLRHLPPKPVFEFQNLTARLSPSFTSEFSSEFHRVNASLHRGTLLPRTKLAGSKFQKIDLLF